MTLDPRIGMLNSGAFYCFPNGYRNPEFSGTLEEVEAILGLRTSAIPAAAKPHVRKEFDVTMIFQYPAWDEVGGIVYTGIEADSKSEANAIARSKAESDGHFYGGKGRVTFKALECD